MHPRFPLPLCRHAASAMSFRDRRSAICECVHPATHTSPMSRPRLFHDRVHACLKWSIPAKASECCTVWVCAAVRAMLLRTTRPVTSKMHSVAFCSGLMGLCHCVCRCCIAVTVALQLCVGLVSAVGRASVRSSGGRGEPANARVVTVAREQHRAAQ